ncbi:glutamate 5-kinase [Anaerosacchariphilus polymeriproducens]|uniref:Glutamate 5-kinase n=1 Tax=Anaerosacchariphilus polymeriproducens TaxID=1812858 RepID=A0A371AU67_9FIRM|nr:glutamate 5-kinase [Anaerosacchariphilus polymeriproducens]RDU23114.1 glutamate 5-kinase [Anaerosacchariphilus polymeriproducens]
METKECNKWKQLKDKKRIVVKIGSSSLNHKITGDLNFTKLEKLVRELCDLRNQGKDVVLVSSGAIAVGRKAIGLKEKPDQVSIKQACAAIGQAKLMMTYQKIFAEYTQVVGQVLMTKNTMLDNVARKNAQNTFEQLLRVGAIPIVNENDTVSTYEMRFGDNDQLSAIVASLIGADLLILLSDIDGLYTDDPRENKNAKFVDVIDKIDDKLLQMGKDTTGSDIGSGGMAAKLTAAKIATLSGADMVIANGKDVRVIHRLIEGKKNGSLFLANKDEDFYIADYIEDNMY